MKTTFEITKEQILELAEKQSGRRAKLKQWFPQAFQSELEVGKWYKRKDELLVWNDGKETYGFNSSGMFKDYMLCSGISNPILPTDKEVETALIAEAKRRGFNKTTMITQTFNENQKMCIGFWDESRIEFTRNKLFAKGVRIFDNGKWAEIISKPIEVTLEQIAEKFNVNVEQLKIKK